ncbi:hypothetical protein A2982_04050 [candidate division WWE3 bacterium RIFCSPLOWO2_01_FULL_39_13]|uniref:Aspartyl/glutamyl-tRNA(Asn/Gln) amidotransferase subunit C n=1 Tax=candidate division WWE3 bacterium RIFCSPLOWO2_01_FULL_39_13 TaxID=1802624 RepID=A0A1F4V205_UNCKA|nr:MAG: hypothetical protein A2982_04050 [candidate division WWE3 bacterium RIFCSPLOWO2_01_FULL_39_13]
MISKDDVLKISRLARLELNESELDKFQRHLAGILQYVEQLNEIDTDEIPPTSHAISDLKSRYQEGSTDSTLSQKEVLENAKEKSDGYIVTKGVL